MEVASEDDIACLVGLMEALEDQLTVAEAARVTVSRGLVLEQLYEADDRLVMLAMALGDDDEEGDLKMSLAGWRHRLASLWRRYAAGDWTPPTLAKSARVCPTVPYSRQLTILSVVIERMASLGPHYATSLLGEKIGQAEETLREMKAGEQSGTPSVSTQEWTEKVGGWWRRYAEDKSLVMAASKPKRSDQPEVTSKTSTSFTELPLQPPGLNHLSGLICGLTVGSGLHLKPGDSKLKQLLAVIGQIFAERPHQAADWRLLLLDVFVHQKRRRDGGGGLLPAPRALLPVPSAAAAPGGLTSTMTSSRRFPAVNPGLFSGPLVSCRGGRAAGGLATTRRLFAPLMMVQCNYCFRVGHPTRDCPIIEQLICFRCGKFGHVRKWCRVDLRTPKEKSETALHQEMSTTAPESLVPSLK